MAAQIDLIADAIAADLVAANALNAFAVQFSTVAKRRLPNTDLAKVTSSPILLIVPADDTGERLDRGGTFLRKYEIHLAVQKKLATTESSDFQTLLTTCEQLLDWYTKSRPTGRAEVLVENDFLTLYSQEHLQTSTVFTSVMSLIFQGQRGAT